MSNLDYQMASWPEERELVAELLVDDEIVGFVRRMDGKVTVTVAAPFESTLRQLSGVLSLIADEFSPEP